MSCKKVVIWSLLIGTMVGIGVSMVNNSWDYKISCLKRKLNCLNRKINRTLSKMSGENINKYKNEILTGFDNIKNKIENLTVKDIKDKGNELFDSLVESINELKQKVIGYSK